MNNAMVKRGIGAVVLAIIAALLLGYLLKDKSRERQEVVDMKLPGAPEINIPSLSEATTSITDSAASLVDEAKEKVTKGGSAVIASAEGTFNTVSDSASESTAAVTEKAKAVISNDSAEAPKDNDNPGFSFRPPKQNEEKVVVENGSTAGDSASTQSTEPTSQNTVVASSAAPELKVEKTFKPTIEPEVAKKQVAKKPEVKKAEVVKAKPTEPVQPATVASSGNGGKYSIQLLATSSQSRANKLAKTMNGEGYVAFITQTTSNNKILYRVRVGGHNERSAAIKAQETMKRRYKKNFFVQNSLVVSK